MMPRDTESRVWPIAALVAVGLLACLAEPRAGAPGGPDGQVAGGTREPSGAVALFDGATLGGWVVENSTAGNFAVVDGLLRVEGPAGWLRSTRAYADFSLHAEVRFGTADADSGVFLRAPGPASNVFMRGWPANAYQVQVRNMEQNRTDAPLWFGHLYRHRVAPGETLFDRDAASRAYQQTGEWHVVDIDADADRIRVRVNGVETTRASGITNPQGYLGIQGETGVVEYRALVIREVASPASK